jgi:DNA/RNA endonuclease YhcR with UshA esterase domain
MRWFTLIGGVLLCSATFAIAEDEPKFIGPAEALKKVEETVVLRMEVKAASIQGNVGFLNSESSHKDEKNFVVFLTPKVISQFRDADIEDPAAHFKGKTVEVKGKVTLHREKPQIILDSFKSIKIIEKDKEKPAKKSK